MKATIRLLQAADAHEFIAASRRSRRLHKPWIAAPCDEEAFARYLARFQAPSNFGFVICTRPADELAGAINLTNIVYGAFRSGYLGFFAFAGFQGQGNMKSGLSAVVKHAFGELGLHRVEANIQPANTRSIALVQSIGFSREGFSPRYLKIGGRWRDHERWALVRR